MKGLKSLARNIFCFSIQGTVFFLFSVFVLAAGILRVDLAALLWASGFFLVTGYTWLGNNLLRIIIKRYLARQPDCINIKLPDHGIYPGEDAQAYLTLKLPSFMLPGFLTRFSLKMVWQDYASCNIETMLSAGETSRIITFAASLRGEYNTGACYILIKDYLGLTKSVINLPLKVQLNVYPVLISSSHTPLKLEVSGADIEYSPRKKTSEELLEIRKYYPGDDVRKINWKAYARLSELFLRIGEETTLPEAKLLFIIDPTHSPFVPDAVRNAYLDILVEHAGSLLLSLLNRGVDIWLLVPGYKKAEALSAEKRELLLNRLSRIRWQKTYHTIPLPPYKNLYAFVFSSPGSLGLEPLVRQLKKTGLKLSLFFPSWQQAQPAVPELTLKHLLFLSDRSKHRQLSVNFDQDWFFKLYRTEAGKFRGAPWRINHVYQV
ncbi:MAG: DUF58 domain-containing protein [Spirochaetales bacterium]|nr:DUF58 domain-containing protein [Spirochaetales bacterium]